MGWLGAILWIGLWHLAVIVPMLYLMTPREDR